MILLLYQVNWLCYMNKVKLDLCPRQIFYNYYPVWIMLQPRKTDICLMTTNKYSLVIIEEDFNTNLLGVKYRMRQIRQTRFVFKLIKPHFLVILRVGGGFSPSFLVRSSNMLVIIIRKLYQFIPEVINWYTIISFDANM